MEEISALLIENEKELQRIGIDIVEMENRIGRIGTVLHVDLQTDQRICK